MIIYDKNREAMIPPDLQGMIERENYRSWVAGLPIEEMIAKGVKIFNDYWEKKFTDKSGG